MPPLVSPSDFWGMSTEIPYWWRVGSASDWSCRMSNILQPLRSSAQIWISLLVPLSLFCQETSDITCQAKTHLAPFFMPLKLHILIASKNILVLVIVSLIEPGFLWQSLHQRRRFMIKLIVSWEVSATPFKCLELLHRECNGKWDPKKTHGKDWTRLPVLNLPLCHWSRWF